MVDNQNNNIFKVLKDFFTGKKSEKGEQVYNQWFDSFDDSRGFLDQLTQEEREQYKNRTFRLIKEEMNESSQSFPTPLKTGSQRKWAVLYKVAAVLVIGALLSLATIHFSDIYESEEVLVSIVEKSNPAGQISEVMLPDSSKVWLSVSSTLKYPEEFSEDQRVVELDGEAYFEVTHDDNHPFIVNSGPLSTQVLGTSFNVKAYQEDSDLRVILATGKVEVSVNNNDQKKILEPNQEVHFEKEKGLGEVRTKDASLAKAWTNKELIFMRDSFATIARTFERWYDVEFVFEDEDLKNEEFVYHFKELSLEKSLNMLKELAEFEYAIEGQKVFIRSPAN